MLSIYITFLCVPLVPASFVCWTTVWELSPLGIILLTLPYVNRVVHTYQSSPNLSVDLLKVQIVCFNLCIDSIVHTYQSSPNLSVDLLKVQIVCIDLCIDSIVHTYQSSPNLSVDLLKVQIWLALTYAIL